MTGIKIRSARSGDAAAIATVYIEAWRATYAGIVPDSVLLEMSQTRQQRVWAHHIQSMGPVLVAVHPQHGVLGVTSGGRCRDREFAGAGEVFTLYVAPDHQGQGYGKALLQAILDALHYTKHDDAMLLVLADNHARFFYEAMGGTRVAERHACLWGATLKEVAYQWRLKSPLPGRGRIGTLHRDVSSSRNGDSTE